MLKVKLEEIVNYYKKQKKEKDMDITTMNNVEWRPVNGFPNYQVCREGIVKGKNGVLSTYKNSSGLACVTLYNEKQKKNKVVSHIVADAFLGGVPDGKIVTYKDKNKDNNCADNLEISSRNDLKLAPKLEKAKTVAYNLSTGESHIYGSAKKAADAFGISESYIRMIRNTEKPYNGWNFDTYFGTKEPDNTRIFVKENGENMIKKNGIVKHKEELNNAKEGEMEMPKNNAIKTAIEMAQQTMDIVLEPEKPKLDLNDLCSKMISGMGNVPNDISAENKNAYMVGFATCMKIVTDEIKDFA